MQRKQTKIDFEAQLFSIPLIKKIHLTCFITFKNKYVEQGYLAVFWNSHLDIMS